MKITICGGVGKLRMTIIIVAMAIFFLVSIQIPTAQSQLISTTNSNNKTFNTFTFLNFNGMINNTNLTAFNDAAFDDIHGALQITPDTLNNHTYLVNTSGRVFLPHPFTLYNDLPTTSNLTNTTTKYVASFNTTFTINIYRVDNTTPGEGLAFIIAPNLDGPPPGSEGGYLGLTNATIDGNTANRIVAIEFDTVKQKFDPDNNHVGLNINTVNSIKTTNFTALGFEFAPVTEKYYTVWIDYDGIQHKIRVYMGLKDQPKPAKAVLTSPLDISQHLAKESYFGFSASTSTLFELNCVLAWNLTVENLSSNKPAHMKVWQIVLLVGGCAAMVVLVISLFVVFGMRKRKAVDPRQVVAVKLRSLPGTPREFKFKELRKATSNFDEKMKLGQGGFGVVFRGVLPAGEDPAEIAVKKFSRDSSGMDDFLKELTIINRLRHKHLVRLVGWCYKNSMLLLVYDYMPNGSLDHHLFSGPDKPLLSWDCRYKIVEGIASALNYLHYEYDHLVVHRDLKASNIMLDASFNARLGDFGLARALDTDKTSYAEIELNGVPGTLGYIAPECFHTGKATRQSDIFGFGAVVLEVVCGRRPRCEVEGFQFLFDWVWKLHREDRILDAIDPRLGGEIVREDAKRLLLLGLACCHPLPCERPKTQVIVQIVSRSVEPPVVPQFKPPFMWPAGPMLDDDEDGKTLTSVTISPSYYASSRETSVRVSCDE